MTTPTPPTPEAVEAAIRYALDQPLITGDFTLLNDWFDKQVEALSLASARILAAEVQRLRALLDEPQGDHHMITTAKALELLAAERERIRQERLTMAIIADLDQEEVRAAKRHTAYWRKRATDAEKRNESLIAEK